MRAQDPAHLGATVSHEVDVWPLDSLDLDDVKSIKLDAEGNEFAILRRRAAHDRALPAVHISRAGGAPCRRVHLVGAGLPRCAALRRLLRPRADHISRQRVGSGPDAPGLECSVVPRILRSYIFEYYFIPREDTAMRRRFMQLAANGFRMEVEACAAERTNDHTLTETRGMKITGGQSVHHAAGGLRLLAAVSRPGALPALTTCAASASIAR